MSQDQAEVDGRIIFTEKMKQDYTILTPMMLPIHFTLFQPIFENAGYHMEILRTQNNNIIEKGLQYAHNDICYPAQLVIGQLLDALESGQYDLNKIAVMMTQTGGGCRASNYVSLLRKALKKAGLAHVPVVSLNFSGMEKNPGFKITLPMLKKLANAVIFGDLLMLLQNQTLPYELEKGASDQMVQQLTDQLSENFRAGQAFSRKTLKLKMREILAAFATIKVTKKDKIRVGVVGEIYIKFAPLGNNNLEVFLRQENAETVVPGLLDFLLYSVDTDIEDYRLYGGSFWRQLFFKKVIKWIEDIQQSMIEIIQEYPQFRPPSAFEHTKSLAKNYIGYGVKMGEGWLLTAEMLELIDQGVYNIVCTQPFGCLPNHVCGRGMIRKIKDQFPEANIVPIDYDASATRVNQENRLKLMLATGRKVVEKYEKSSDLHEFESGQ